MLAEKDKADEELTIPTSEIVLALRDRLGITEEIHHLIFGDEL
jgi:hypothetical protein